MNLPASTNGFDLSRATREQKLKYVKLLAEKVRREKRLMLKRTLESFYDWQNRFNAATKEFIACLLMAANQVGKSRTGCAIDAVHITGDYPEDWEGHVFEHPPVVWLLGYSGEKVRDLLQHKIFGRLENGQFSGGLIQPDRILGYRSMQGTTGACREITAKHATGGVTIVQFWSYSQGQHALMGDVVDWYHIDEEPEDHEIFPQVITRTLNGDRGKGGRGILTLTPENGKTELVKKFQGDTEDEHGNPINPAEEGLFLLTATWEDAPHLSEEVKRKILAAYPSYQRAMRSRGEPLMGSGLIFEHDPESYEVAPFPIPDHFFLINGHDFGWDHPLAHVQLAWDRDADCIYVTQAFRKRKCQPFEAWASVRAWSKGVPTAWPGDGLQHKQQAEGKEAVQHKKLFEDEGFFMLPEHATFEDGGNGVWTGILMIDERIRTGRFKVFKGLKEVFEEMRQYHTKTMDNGQVKIVKIGEDLIDAIRYAIMMIRFAKSAGEIRNPPSNKRDRGDRDWRTM